MAAEVVSPMQAFNSQPDASLIEESLDVLARGDLESAISRAQTVVERSPTSPDAFRKLALVLEAAGDLYGAVEALQELGREASLNGDEEFRLSALLCRIEKFELAADHAAAAVARNPERIEFVRHAANLFGMTNRHGEAVRLNVLIMQISGEDANLYHQTAASCAALGRKELAVKCAERAHQIDPSNFEYLIALVQLLVNDQQYESAVARLRVAGEDVAGQRTVSFLLSFCLAALKRFDEALAAVDKGVRSNPSDIELRMHRGSVLCCLRRYEDACEDFRFVLKRDADHSGARRACFAALTEAGLYGDAVALGAELLVADPHDYSIGRTMTVVLGHHFSEFAGSGQMTGLDLLAAKRAAMSTGSIKLAAPSDALMTQISVLYALTMREITTKFGRARLGFVWAVFEPLAHIGLMISLISGFGHGRPPFGDSFAIFYFTGIIPYHLATHTSSGLLHAIESNRPVLQIPIITTLDVFVAKGLVEIFTEACVALTLLFIFMVLGLNALPEDPLKVFRGLFLLWTTALGVGLLNACVATYLTSWQKIWGALTGVLYFASGTFYVPAMMPVWARDILDWNPVLQAIEIVRSGFFAGHDPVWMSERYLGLFAAISLVVGLTAQRLTRRRLLSH